MHIHAHVYVYLSFYISTVLMTPIEDPDSRTAEALDAVKKHSFWKEALNLWKEALNLRNLWGAIKLPSLT